MLVAFGRREFDASSDKLGAETIGAKSFGAQIVTQLVLICIDLTCEFRRESCD